MASLLKLEITVWLFGFHCQFIQGYRRGLINRNRSVWPRLFLLNVFTALKGIHFYVLLVYKFKRIMGRTEFSDQFRKVIIRYKRIGYNLIVIWQSAYLVINPITIDNFAALFNCTPVDRASNSMMARPKAIHLSWLGPYLFRLLLGPLGLN